MTSARPCQSLLPGIVVDIADQRRPFGAGHLAGHLVVRTSKPGRFAKVDGHLAGMSPTRRPSPGLLWRNAKLAQSSSSRRGFTTGLYIQLTFSGLKNKQNKTKKNPQKTMMIHTQHSPIHSSLYIFFFCIFPPFFFFLFLIFSLFFISFFLSSRSPN